MMECNCCKAKAKYLVDGNGVCGRHLNHYIYWVLTKMGEEEVSVTLIED